MKRFYTLFLCCTLAIMAMPTQSKAISSAAMMLIGSGAFYVGSEMGKKWEREDPRRSRAIIIQPEQQQSYAPVEQSNYATGPSGRYYYQATQYNYEPQRVIIRDSY